jgi:hypothetical protein
MSGASLLLRSNFREESIGRTSDRPPAGYGRQAGRQDAVNIEATLTIATLIRRATMADINTTTQGETSPRIFDYEFLNTSAAQMGDKADAITAMVEAVRTPIVSDMLVAIADDLNLASAIAERALRFEVAARAPTPIRRVSCGSLDDARSSSGAEGNAFGLATLLGGGGLAMPAHSACHWPQDNLRAQRHHR